MLKRHWENVLGAFAVLCVVAILGITLLRPLFEKPKIDRQLPDGPFIYVSLDPDPRVSCKAVRTVSSVSQAIGFAGEKFRDGEIPIVIDSTTYNAGELGRFKMQERMARGY